MLSARDTARKEEDRRLMTRGRRLPSDGSARCLAASAAQLRTPYVRVAGSPLRAGASEQPKSRAERAAEPGRPPYAPSPTEPRRAPPSRAGDSVASSAPDASSAPVLPNAATPTRKARGSSCAPPPCAQGSAALPSSPRAVGTRGWPGAPLAEVVGFPEQGSTRRGCGRDPRSRPPSAGSRAARAAPPLPPREARRSWWLSLPGCGSGGGAPAWRPSACS